MSDRDHVENMIGIVIEQVEKQIKLVCEKDCGSPHMACESCGITWLEKRLEYYKMKEFLLTE